MHMLHNVKMSLFISNFCIAVFRSETEPLVLQFMYVSHDHDMRYLYCGVDIVLYITCILALRLELVRSYQAAEDYLLVIMCVCASVCLCVSASVRLCVCDFGSAPPTPGGNESQLA